MQGASRPPDTHKPALDGKDTVNFYARLAWLMPGLVYVFNHETMSNEYANRSVADFLGYSEQEVQKMGDAVLLTLMHPDDFAQLPQHFLRLAALGPEEQASYEYRVRAKDGAEIWLRSVDTVIDRSSDGRVLRHVGIATDITAQKSAEAQLSGANQALEARVAIRTAELRALNEDLEQRVLSRTAELKLAHEELRQLTFIATHDLRVPVNNMSSLVNMLEDASADLSEHHIETLGWMHEVCAQATEKLDTLICAAQANDGPAVPREMVSVGATLDIVLASLRSQIKSAKAHVLTAIDAQSICFLPQSLETVLQALIGNALKYRNPARRLQIKVRSFRRGHSVVVEVRDNGTGIDMQRDGDKVFALFQRAHVEPQGAGTSLYMIRRIVESYGGTISLESNLGEGSVFSVSIPDMHPGGAA